MTKNNTYRFLLSGGGTGGHIFPAVSIAREIRRRLPEAEILFAGAEGKMEMQRVPEAGFPIEGLPIAGLQRRLTWKNLLLPWKIGKSMKRAFEIIDRFRPHAVIGTGGYASAPVAWAAQFKGIPVFLQEQNAYPGLTNRFLARKARKVFTAYPAAARYFPASKVVLTGNPVRPELSEPLPPRRESLAAFGWEDDSLPVVLILGGSLGSAAINRFTADMVRAYGERLPFRLLWQTGKLYYERYKDLENDRVRIVPFIGEMDKAYGAASVIVSRAGAGTLSELALAGKPVILIPSVNVAEDHQTKNARALAEEGAAVLLPEKEGERLFDELQSLLGDPARMERLGARIRRHARPSATKAIVDAIFRELGIDA
ncbi:MAG: undecaprenyldiphospho-muramoylpentapeptide beta-N-acetylglucosaminyltransferase [Chlorobi bacterium]|nr:undecaprenyldiphospho-muramoylpentapeptide beta-N-acetylglucosaminyltransferase [Chlorobiota bacterium]